MAADLNDLDPSFAGPFNRFLDAARARGIQFNVLSGYRDAQAQKELYANFLAGKRRQPLPFPGRGPVSLAAPPGSSLHERGTAADVQAVDPKQQSVLWDLAGQYGLNAPFRGSDPAHFQLASNKPSAPTNIASRGTTLNSLPESNDHTAFILDYARKVGLDPNLALGIANVEGLRAWGPNNPNAASYVDRTNGVPWSFGDFQLNVRNGLGADARRAGIDPANPSQWREADKFALDYMKAHGVGAWSGDPVAASYLKTGAVPGAMAMAAMTRPMSYTPSGSPQTAAAPTPSGIGSDYVAGLRGAPTAAVGATAGNMLPGFTTQGASDNFTKGVAALDKGLGGGSAGGGGGGDAPQAPPMPPMEGPHMPDPSQSSAMMASIINHPALTWGSAPQGAISPFKGAGMQGGLPPEAQQMLQQLAMMSQSYGTTLGSTPDFGGWA